MCWPVPPGWRVAHRYQRQPCCCCSKHPNAGAMGQPSIRARRRNFSTGTPTPAAQSESSTGPAPRAGAPTTPGEHPQSGGDVRHTEIQHDCRCRRGLRTNRQPAARSVRHRRRRTLKDVWKAQDGPWGRAFSVTGPGFATAGAQPAAVWQPLDQHLEVFAIDNTGTLKVTWKQNDGPWAAAVSLSGPGLDDPVHQSPLSGSRSTSTWRFLLSMARVWFRTCGSSTIRPGSQHSRSLDRTLRRPARRCRRSGSRSTSIWRCSRVDSADGTVNDVWKAHDGGVAAARSRSQRTRNSAAPVARCRAVWQPLDEHLEVFGVDPTPVR